MQQKLALELRNLWNEDTTVKQNYFTRRNEIPLLRNSYKGHSKLQIIGINEFLGFNNIIIIGSPSSGKTTVAKRIGFWESNFFRRPLVMFDPTGHEYKLCKYANSDTTNLLRVFNNEPIEKPEGLKNLLSISPSYAIEEANGDDMIISLTPNDFDMEHWTSVGLRNISHILDEAKELYPEVSKDPEKLYNFIRRMPVSYKQVLELGRKDELFVHSSTHDSFMVKFRKLLKQGFFDKRYKTDFDKLIQLLKTKSLCFNFHYEEEFSRAYVGYIMNKLFRATRRGIIPPPITLTDESEKVFPSFDKDKEFASTKQGSLYVKKGRKYGLGNIAVSQELSSIHKDITDFYTYLIIGGELSRNDLRRLAELTSEKVMDIVRHLKFDPDVGQREMIIIRRNKTYDTGYSFNSPCGLFKEIRKSIE